jgi:hypothetical protein
MTDSKKVYPDKGEKVRIKVKYSEIIKTVANDRDESFLDALYFIIDSFWHSYKRGEAIPQMTPKTIIHKEELPVYQVNTPQKIDDDDIDISDFE